MDFASLITFQKMETWASGVADGKTYPTLPDAKALEESSAAIIKNLPNDGLGVDQTAEHIMKVIVPGLNGQSLSPNYYGFVTGGITPSARLADSVVSLFDQNAAVHLPRETVTSIVEDRALRLLLELFDFKTEDWPTCTFTTGATASNILGLACGREYVITQKLARIGAKYIEGEGLLSACLRAGIQNFQVLTTLPHSSLGKAANIVGLGSASLIDVSKSNDFLRFDMAKLEEHLSKPNTASVVTISCGEVNTGKFATNSREEVQAIRELCDKYDAWLHVDAGKLPSPYFLPYVNLYDILNVSLSFHSMHGTT
jgi:glutamate/tyrosine decarboxylase-like PLP-dependent enzyme